MSRLRLAAFAALCAFISAGTTEAQTIETVNVSSSDAVNRPFTGFGINWNPYWDKPSTLPAHTLALTTAQWQTVYNRLNYSSYDMMRTMILPEWVNPTGTAGGNNYNTEMMNALYKVLDYQKAHNIEVAFGFWDARAPFNDDEGSSVYINTLVSTIDYLVNTKGYTNIKYVILANEPQHRFPGGVAAAYTPYKTAINTLYSGLSSAGLLSQVKVMAPDVGNDGTAWLGQIASDIPSKVASYEWHDYPPGQNDIKNASAGTQLQTLKNTITTNDPSSTSKPLILTEMGWFYGVSNDVQSNITTYQYGVEVSDLALSGARNGWSSLAWYADDQSNDKYWGQWDITNAPALRPWFYPWTLLSRFFPKDTAVYNPANPTDIRVLAGKKVVSGQNKWSIAIINRRTTPSYVKVQIPGEGGHTLIHYQYQPASNPKDGNGFPLPSTFTSENLATGVTVLVPANSMYLVTDMPTTTSVDDSQSGTGIHQWSYTGSWTPAYNTTTNEFNWSDTFSGATNAAATLSFYGTQVKLYSHVGGGGGIAALSIDGGAETAVSLYSTATAGNVLSWTSPVLARGSHTFKVRVTGTHAAGSTGNYVALDRAEVIN